MKPPRMHRRSERMAIQPIWMRRSGRGDLSPRSSYAHDEARNSFIPCNLGQRGGASGMERLSIIADSRGGSIAVYVDLSAADSALQAAVEAFRLRMADTPYEELKIHSLVCVPTFAPRTLLRRRNGALRRREGAVALLVGKRFETYTTAYSFNFDSELIVDWGDVSYDYTTILTVSRPSDAYQNSGDPLPTTSSRAPAENDVSPWLSDSYSSGRPFWFPTIQYESVIVPVVPGIGDAPNGQYPVIARRDSIAQASGFTNAAGVPALAVEATMTTLPNLEWLAQHISDYYSLNISLPDIEDWIAHHFRAPGTYVDPESGRTAGVVTAARTERLEFRELEFAEPWHASLVDPPLWFNNSPSFSISPQKANFRRWIALKSTARPSGSAPITCALRVRLNGNGWDILDVNTQMAYRHRVTFVDYSAGGHLFTIADPLSGEVLATSSSPGNGSTVVLELPVGRFFQAGTKECEFPITAFPPNFSLNRATLDGLTRIPAPVATIALGESSDLQHLS